jgi:hypothetical protein
MRASVSRSAFSASFGKVTLAVSDAYFMAEPAAAVIVSANARLRARTGGAHEVAQAVAKSRYAAACSELLHGLPTVYPKAPPG